MTMKMVKLCVELDEKQAWALAQFIKRAGLDQCRPKAVNDDEAYVMRDGAAKVGAALAEAGYAAR